MVAHPLERRRGSQVACLVVGRQLTAVEAVLRSILTRMVHGQLTVVLLEG